MEIRSQIDRNIGPFTRLEEQLEETITPGEFGEPRFPHNCDKKGCRFLGTYEEFDLYNCDPKTMIFTVVVSDHLIPSEGATFTMDGTRVLLPDREPLNIAAPFVTAYDRAKKKKS
jgi:hypothetical protein